MKRVLSGCGCVALPTDLSGMECNTRSMHEVEYKSNETS